MLISGSAVSPFCQGVILRRLALYLGYFSPQRVSGEMKSHPKAILIKL